MTQTSVSASRSTAGLYPVHERSIRGRWQAHPARSLPCLPDCDSLANYDGVDLAGRARKREGPVLRRAICRAHADHVNLLSPAAVVVGATANRPWLPSQLEAFGRSTRRP